MVRWFPPVISPCPWVRMFRSWSDGSRQLSVHVLELECLDHGPMVPASYQSMSLSFLCLSTVWSSELWGNKNLMIIMDWSVGSAEIWSSPVAETWNLHVGPPVAEIWSPPVGRSLGDGSLGEGTGVIKLTTPLKVPKYQILQKGC